MLISETSLTTSVQLLHGSDDIAAESPFCVKCGLPSLIATQKRLHGPVIRLRENQCWPGILAAGIRFPEAPQNINDVMVPSNGLMS